MDTRGYLVAVTNITFCSIGIYTNCEMTFEVGAGRYLEVLVV
jgi:hypothetical protein